ncbi:MAG: FGGY family carbohydrate kinase [Candidatus Nanopelagicales bacterium]
MEHRGPSRREPAVRVLAIDQGTSGTKALDRRRRRRGRGGRVAGPPPLPCRRPGRAGPTSCWPSVLDAGRRAVARAGGSIDAVALANQGETVLAWDPATGAPHGVALVWQDGRAQDVCDGLRDSADEIASLTGRLCSTRTSPRRRWPGSAAT